MGAAGASAGQALITSIVWEAAEPVAKRAMPGMFPRSTIDTPQNKVGDTASLLFGWWLANKKKR